MYLRIILECEEEGVPPLSARIAERVGRSAPTVHHGIDRLKQQRLITVDERRRLVLSRTGRPRAVAVMRRHRLAELWLIRVLGVPYGQAHHEADRLQQALSDRVERAILRRLGGPARSPYGNVIPGLQQIGGDPASRRRIRGETSLDGAGRAGVVALTRVSEWAQGRTGLLAELFAAGIRVGCGLTVCRKGDEVVLGGSEGEVRLPRLVARGLFVTPRLDEAREVPLAPVVSL